MKIILEANNLSKTYKINNEIINVLNGINLCINEGELVVLIGPSGSGKSTLLNILGTIDNNYDGIIKINNINIKSDEDLSYVRSNMIGFIFQFHHLLPEFTIIENLKIPKLLSNNTGEDIDKLLDYIGLTHRKDHYPDQISGGERQRVAVLRALINKPALILADEPTGNLDRENSKLLLNLISSIKEKYQQSFIIATHDESIADIADRIFTLKDGKLKEGI